MSSSLSPQDQVLATRIITLMQELDATAVEQRLTNNQAATNCAQAAAPLRQWLNELGLAPRTVPLA
jgi:hypothetical protein